MTSTERAKLRAANARLHRARDTYRTAKKIESARPVAPLLFALATALVAVVPFLALAWRMS